MIRTTANPKRLILWGTLGTSKYIYHMIQNSRWLDGHPIPVFKAPKEFVSLGDYILNDGHKRVIAALKRGKDSVPILILEDTLDISKTIGEQSRPYDEVYQNAINITREKYEDPIMRTRLSSARGKQ